MKRKSVPANGPIMGTPKHGGPPKHGGHWSSSWLVFLLGWTHWIVRTPKHWTQLIGGDSLTSWASVEECTCSVKCFAVRSNSVESCGLQNIEVSSILQNIVGIGRSEDTFLVAPPRSLKFTLFHVGHCDNFKLISLHTSTSKENRIRS